MPNNDHVLDTNIVLSIVLPGNRNYEIAKLYLREKYNRYVSDTLCDESDKKISDIKEFSLSVSEFVKKYSIDNDVDLMKLDYILSKIEKSFINYYKCNDYPINVTECRFEGMVEDFFKDYADEIKEILILSDNNQFNQQVRTSYRKNYIKLNKFLGNFNHFSIKNNNNTDYLRQIGLDKTDAILIDEASQLALSKNNSVNFVTLDKNILKLKDMIFKAVSENVMVSSPIEFVSVNN